MRAFTISSEILTDELTAAACKAIHLIFSSKMWINRRVDSVTFPDPMTLSRSVSVDISLPERSTVPKIDQFYLLPIAMLSKEDMVNFSSRDEANRSWALCTFERTKTIEQRMLRIWGEACGVNISDAWAERVICHDPQSREDANILDEISADPVDRRRAAFISLCRMLARNRILFVCLDEYPGDSKGKLFRFSYDRPVFFRKQFLPAGEEYISPPVESRVAYGDSWWRRLWRQGSSFDMVISASNTSYARHYHFQATAPSGAAITSAWFYNEATSEIYGRSRRGATRCDLYSRGQEVPTGTRGRVLLEFVPVRQIWMIATSIASALMALILLSLGVFSIVSEESIAESDGVSAAVVAFVSVLLTAIMQPEENSFARKLLWRMRASALLCAALSAIAFVLYFVIPDSWVWIPTIGGGVLVAIMCIYRLFPTWSCSQPLASQGEERPNSNPGCEGEKINDLFDGRKVYYQPLSPIGRSAPKGNFEHHLLMNYRVQECIAAIINIDWCFGEEWDRWWVRAPKGSSYG